MSADRMPAESTWVQGSTEANSNPEETSPTDSRLKKAACLNCRRSKIRCIRDLDGTRCEKCRQTGTDCIVPDYHVGRQKGIKNKRRGLDKALYQIEEALKKSKSKKTEPESGRSVSELQTLLNEAQTLLIQNRESTVLTDEHRSPSSMASSRHIPSEDNLALDDAENPLQMLARASDLRLSQLTLSNDRTPTSPQSRSSATGHTLDQNDKSDIHWFFAPIRANPDFGKDIGPDVDPVSLGLATIEEAEMLFKFFFQHLAHTRWGFDPLVHTFNFVRTQSAFLFTSMLAASALFLPAASALSKRLSGHRNMLAHRVMTSRNRSVEIVLGFLLNVPWMPPGEHSADDETGLYLSMALTIALDLSLNKIVLPTNFNPDLFKHLARADCIDGKKALYMDGFEDIDPLTDYGRRLLRRRERAWIALFVLERGVCLARGRSYSVPVTPILENCDNWHVSDIADSQDGSVASMAVLRRDLDGLFKSVRSSCDRCRVIDTGSDIAQSVKATIETFYDRWFATWAFTIGEGEQRSLPPYVEILVIHTRLSTYSGVINHPTAPVEVKRFFRAAGLSSALNVMRAAIQGEKRLKSMPNNTAIMISFAACFALSLSRTTTGTQLTPSIRNLIEEAANVLERIGATPPHRNGASALYGRYLRELVRRAPEVSQSAPTGNPGPILDGVEPTIRSSATFVPDFGPIIPQSNTHATQPDLLPPSNGSQPLQFSAMSDDQIVEAVNRAGTTWDMSLTNANFDEVHGLEWFDWGNPEFGF